MEYIFVIKSLKFDLSQPQDMETIKRDLEQTRKKLHGQVRDFQDMQFQPEWSGFNLKPLNKDEIGSIIDGESGA